MAATVQEKQFENEQRREQYAREFKRLDTNNDGKLDRYEIRELVRCLHVPSDQEVDAVMASYDKNKDGNISFDEFVEVFTRVEAVSTEKFSSNKENKGQQTTQIKIDDNMRKLLREEFDKLDTNKSGGINRKEARKLAQDKYHPPQDLVEKIWGMMDTNKDSAVSLQEFFAIMEKIGGYLPALVKAAQAPKPEEKKDGVAPAAAGAAAAGAVAASAAAGAGAGAGPVSHAPAVNAPAKAAAAPAPAQPAVVVAAAAAPALIHLNCPLCKNVFAVAGNTKKGTVVACPYCSKHVATP